MSVSAYLDFRNGCMRFQFHFFHYLFAGLAAVIVASCPSVAQNGPAMLQGQVVNALNGEPVPLAHVLLRASNPQWNKAAIADSSGHFTMRDIQPGQ
jgi:hypothetical protein